jgi:hypothetical protein
MTSELILPFWVPLRLDNGISNFPGSGVLGLQPIKMEHGWMIVSAYLSRNVTDMLKV